MNFVRSLVRDLVDKRLWPIAIVLVVALVAAPVMLGGGGDSASGDVTLSAPPTEDAAAATVAAVQLTGPPSVRSRPGTTRNPFRRPPVKTEDTQTAAADAPAAGGSADASPSTGGSTPTVPQDDSADADADAEAAAIAARSYYRTEIRMGSIERETPSKVRPLSRLTPLPSLARSAMIYLGVSSRGATFLLAPGVTATGDGRCNDTDCRIVSLEEGESTLVDVTPADGGAVRQYTLEVETVEKVTRSEGVAKTMRARVHPDGRDVLRDMLTDAGVASAIGPITYDLDSGLLVPATASVEKVSE